jgi:hypothetical protein
MVLVVMCIIVIVMIAKDALKSGSGFMLTLAAANTVLVVFVLLPYELGRHVPDFVMQFANEGFNIGGVVLGVN